MAYGSDFSEYEQFARFPRDMSERPPPYLIDDHLPMPTYEIGDKWMKIHDVVWGECEIGDQPYDELFVKLAKTPLFQRLQSIEQLTLVPDYATMPNSTDFSRWQHIWGSLVFVRKMTEGDERFDARERAILQLRTLLSDVGHTAFSHLGDWLFQGIDGGEDLHDQDLKNLLEVTGIEQLLEENGFTLEETVFPDVKDWVECDSPDLCVDRVDYGMREILRWGVPTIPLNLYLQELQDPKNFFIIDEDKQLVMKNAQAARYFCAGFSLLPTEHWMHPTHRLQLELLQTMIKGALVDEMDTSDLHPRELLYGVDADFNHLFQTWDALFLNTTMKEIAIWQRRIFMEGRRHDLNQVFMGISDPMWQFPDFPEPLQPYSWQTEKFVKPIPPNVDIVESDEVDTQAMQASGRGLEVDLPPLKARAVDPLVRVGNKSIRFSEIEPSYKAYLAGQRATMAKGYKATILMRRDVAVRIAESSAAVGLQWEQATYRERSAASLARKVLDSQGISRRGFDTTVQV
jgi:HD superfamily phosphohydrolase